MSACECGRAAGHAGLCARRCGLEGCEHPHHASGLCSFHWQRNRRYGSPLAGPSLHIEDVEWMAETGETWERAAERVGYLPDSLERALERMGRGDLVTRLKRRRVAVA